MVFEVFDETKKVLLEASQKAAAGLKCLEVLEEGVQDAESTPERVKTRCFKALGIVPDVNSSDEEPNFLAFWKDKPVTCVTTAEMEEEGTLEEAEEFIGEEAQIQDADMCEEEEVEAKNTFEYMQPKTVAKPSSFKPRIAQVGRLIRKPKAPQSPPPEHVKAAALSSGDKGKGKGKRPVYRSAGPVKPTLGSSIPEEFKNAKNVGQHLPISSAHAPSVVLNFGWSHAAI